MISSAVAFLAATGASTAGAAGTTPARWTMGRIVEPGTGRADHAEPHVAIRADGSGAVAWTTHVPHSGHPYDGAVRAFDRRGEPAQRIQTLLDFDPWAIATDPTGAVMVTASTGNANFRMAFGRVGSMRAGSLGPGRPNSTFNLGTAAPLDAAGGLRLAGIAPLRGAEVYRPAASSRPWERTILAPSASEFSFATGLDAYSVAWGVSETGAPLLFAHAVSGRDSPSPSSQRALFRLGGEPSVMPVPGEGGALADITLSAAGAQVAVAGIVDPDETWGFGRVVVLMGSEHGLGPQVPVDLPAAAHALEPRIAALPGGGAIVTWIDDRGTSNEGLPEWARVDAAGHVIDSGVLSDRPGWSVESVAAGGSAWLVWGEQDPGSRRVGLRAARIDQAGLHPVVAPRLTGQGRTAWISLAASGGHVAMGYELPGLPARVSLLRTD